MYQFSGILHCCQLTLVQ